MHVLAINIQILFPGTSQSVPGVFIDEKRVVHLTLFAGRCQTPGETVYQLFLQRVVFASAKQDAWSRNYFKHYYVVDSDNEYFL